MLHPDRDLPKEQMLASGILEKGDIIYMEPVDWNHSNSDCHIGFFWGSSSSEDLYWHSSSHADGIVKGYFPNLRCSSYKRC